MTEPPRCRSTVAAPFDILCRRGYKHDCKRIPFDVRCRLMPGHDVGPAARVHEGGVGLFMWTARPA